MSYRFGPWSSPREPEQSWPPRWVATAALWLSLASVLALFALVLSGRVGAQEGSRAPGERYLIAVLSRVSLNEGGPADDIEASGYADLALLHQIAEGHGTTPLERGRWMASHSSCAAGDLAPRSRRMTQDDARERPGNCRWARNVHPDGRRPRGWARELDGHWSRMRPRWLAHLDRVRAFVAGTDTYRPCRGEVQSWDGRPAEWQRRARARGWVPADCDDGARNIGYMRASSEGS
jgi:hypothetical protein